MENAMREYMDADSLRDLEQSVDSLIWAGGYTPSEQGAEKKSSETLRSEDTTLVNRRVDTDLRERFMAYVKEETEFGTSYGLALGYALREYRQSSRAERTTEKFDRLADDLGTLLSHAEDGTLTKQDREAAEICRRLPEQFPREHLHETIEDVTGRDTEYILSDRTERVLDHGEYTTHPFNPEMFVLESEVEGIIERRRQQRKEEAEAETEKELDALTSGTLSPDGAGAMTDGGRD